MKQDIASTICSVMGIDWSQTTRDTPSSRDFDYIELFVSRKMHVSRESEFFVG